jgi:hypothetical protein
MIGKLLSKTKGYKKIYFDYYPNNLPVVPPHAAWPGFHIYGIKQRFYCLTLFQRRMIPQTGAQRQENYPPI